MFFYTNGTTCNHQKSGFISYIYIYNTLVYILEKVLYFPNQDYTFFAGWFSLISIFFEVAAIYPRPTNGNCFNGKCTGEQSLLPANIRGS
jgi:hypothetical protein